MSTSPSGLTAAISASNVGFASRSRRSSSARSIESPQPRQTTRARLPCSSITDARAAGLVQAVDVLRDDAADEIGVLQRGDRRVARVRRGPRDRAPAEIAARPVAPAAVGVAGERLKRHRLAGTAGAGLPAIVRDPGFGRQSGAAQHHDSPAGDQLGEAIDLAV